MIKAPQDKLQDNKNGTRASEPSERTRGTLADRLRRGTRGLHAEAERSGIVREILRGAVSLDAYLVYLRNLLPAYQALERALNGNRHRRGVRRVAHPAVYRARALESDLEALFGEGWRDGLPVLPVADRYARRITAVGNNAPAGLIAHAYTRYLGDLNGGRVLRGRLARSLGLDASALAFYRFSHVADRATFIARYRQSIDQAGTEIADPVAVVEEAMTAFKLNIDLSCAVHDDDPSHAVAGEGRRGQGRPLPAGPPLG